MNKIINFAITRYKTTLLIIAIITVPMAYFYASQTFHNHIDIYFDKKDPNLITYKNFQKTYGNEEVAVIAIKMDDLFTVETITKIRKITQKLLRTEGIQRVFSITKAEEARGYDNAITFEQIIPKGKFTQKDLDEAKKRLLKNKVYVNSLLSQDGKTTAILAELLPLQDNEKKYKILAGIKRSAREIAGDNMPLRFSGSSFIETELNTLSRQDAMRFTPVTLFIIFIVIAFLLKRVALSAVCMLNLGIVAFWGIGFLILTGETMNMTTNIIPPVLLAISIADGIHLLTHYRDAVTIKGMAHREAVENAARSVWLPCLFTSLTTSIGFMSFLASSIRPVKIVGFYTAAGVMFAFILTFTFLPAALMLLEKRFTEKPLKAKLSSDDESGHETAMHRSLLAIGRFSVKRNRELSLLFLGIVIITVIGIFRISFETNFSEYLPDNSTLRTDIDFIEENLGGTVPFIILIRAKDQAHDFTHPESIALVNEVQEHIMTGLDQFTSSFSIADYFKEMHRAFNDGNESYYKIPGKQVDVLDYFELGDAEVLNRIVSFDRMEARISFQSHYGTNEAAKENNAFIIDYMKNKLGKNYSYVRTGLSPLYLTMGDNLKESQIKSFILAFVIIFFMMWFVCIHFGLTVISMLPNLFPIFLTLGIMGWFGIPLDVSTIMIASVVIGIAVDDTIHFLVWFRRHRMDGNDPTEAILMTFTSVGKAITITSFVLFLGFFILIIASTKPTVTFGVLSAFSMLFALLGDIFVLPAIIMTFKPKVLRKEKQS